MRKEHKKHVMIGKDLHVVGRKVGTLHLSKDKKEKKDTKRKVSHKRKTHEKKR